MSLAADALQPRIVRGLISLSGRAPAIRLADVITDGPGAGFDLDFDATNPIISIDFREPTFIAGAVASDAVRFATACFMSMKEVASSVEHPDTIAWTFIRMYYAAFYGGHAVLRVLGQSCTQLEGRHVSKLRNLALALGNTPAYTYPAGLYHCVLNPAQTGMTLTQAAGRVGGAHEAFWEIFDSFLSEAAEEVLTGRLATADATAVFAKIQAVRSIFKKGAGASWLSAVRNDIQYRHGRGVWPPGGVSRADRAVLARLAGQWSRDPLNIDVDAPPMGELGAFVAACAFTSALCRVVITRVAVRSSVGARSFAYHALRYC